MLSKLLCTDVFAVRCMDDLIFVGMGCTLYIFNVDTFGLEKKINCLYPYNIHGIVEGPDNKLTVFGANLFHSYKIDHKQGKVMYVSSIIFRRMRLPMHIKCVEDCFIQSTMERDTSEVIKEDSDKKGLNDWIITVKWFMLNESNYLCILLAHNNIQIYDCENECYQNLWCEEKCILYGGSILINNNEDLTIFSGTVYQEILIWKVDFANHVETSPVLHRLQGHNGVIFSVIYDPVTQFIYSTSDDRTVRLWKVTDEKSKGNNVINWRDASIKLTRTMFGHTARVWKSIIRNRTLITIGEDSLMCIWSLDGELLNKVYAHHGAAIWSIDISDNDKIIFTGGADGAVHAWPFANNYVQKTVLLLKEHTCSVPKYVCYLKNGSLLVFNENGTLFVFNKWHNNSSESLYLEKYVTYCIMEVSLCRSYVCFASRDGYITVYKEIEAASGQKLEQVLEIKAMDSQILSMQWLEDNKIVICGLNGIIKVFNFTAKGSFVVQYVCLLPHSRERWLTAAVVYEGLLVCGDRAGNMHIFQPKKSVLHNNVLEKNVLEIVNKPIQTFTKVHGKIGIQNIIIYHSKLVSAGRDGILRFYELSKQKTTTLLRTLHKEKMPMDWISGHLKLPDDILILGFKEVEFVICSMVYHRTLIRVPCGGGHRSWDCTIFNELVTFLYIRNKQVYVCDFPLSAFTSPVLLNGFHTKEVHCIKPILKVNQYNIFISGGEDGTLRINYVPREQMKNNFRTLGIFDGHISSIKFVTCLSLDSNFSCNKHLVFSGGGRAQIKVWEMNIRDSKTLLQSIDISCHDITSHMLYGFDRQRRKQWRESNQSYIVQPETRYMDIAVYRYDANLNYILLFVACADGFVRIFLYDVNRKIISLKISAKCVDRCVTKVTLLTYNERVIVLTMSTDGTGRFIDFTDTVLEIKKFPLIGEQELQNCKCIAEFNLHQSGINSYDIKVIGKDEYMLATGGDDNLFNIIRFKVQFLSEKEELHVSLLSKWNTSTAHEAQITGIIFQKGNKICSVGTDQQVIVYRYSYDNNDTLSVTILKRIYTFVTDVKGLTSWHNSKDESIVCVYGKGFEILSS